MDIKLHVRQSVEKIQNKLIEVSHKIHAEPELAFQEAKASAWLIEALTDAGFTVKKGICNLPTAFLASSGTGPLHIVICAEYDALPEVGHACGHNIIAASALGAAIATASIADEIGVTISIMGTPAEESGGGKLLLIESGAFKGMHAAMMIHPAPADLLAPNMISAVDFEVIYTGKESHASAFPEEGINAADALTVAQVAIGLLRQQINPTDRIHGITTKGGDAPNIIPARTSARYIVRSQTLKELDVLKAKVLRCFEAGAIATGSQMEVIQKEQPYAEMHYDADIGMYYKKNAESLGRVFLDSNPLYQRFAGSTDMGNVSLVLPSIHPTIGINSLPAVNHQAEFAAYCVSSDADKAVIDGSLAMAWTIVDIATDKKLRERLLK